MVSVSSLTNGQQFLQVDFMPKCVLDYMTNFDSVMDIEPI